MAQGLNHILTSFQCRDLGRIESVFLNIPYDREFEDLYLAYIVGLTELGLKLNLTLAVPNDRRLDTIIDLIEDSNFSIHDLSRIQLSSGIPRFNMPLELGLALYRARISKAKHRVYVFESEAYRAQRSTSDINGVDPQIHGGTPKGVMAGLRNIFFQPTDMPTVDEMIETYNAIKASLSLLRHDAGDGSLFESAIFKAIAQAASEQVRIRKLKIKRGIPPG